MDNLFEKSAFTQVGEFIHEYHKMQERMKVLAKVNGELDKKISDIYHKIEVTQLTHVSVSHNLIMELKKTLTLRRKVKSEHQIIHTLSQFISIKNIESASKSLKEQRKKFDEYLMLMEK